MSKVEDKDREKVEVRFCRLCLGVEDRDENKNIFIGYVEIFCRG